MLVALVACDRVAPGDDGPRVLELDADTIRLESGVRLIDVRVERQAGGEFDPSAVEARQGDVIRFTAGDHGGHAIAFDAAGLTAEMMTYLERTGQLRSPPLITSGSAWVIKLDDAPAGTYTFRCATHDVSGRLTITQR
jgi:plastocyanin